MRRILFVVLAVLLSGCSVYARPAPPPAPAEMISNLNEIRGYEVRCTDVPRPSDDEGAIPIEKYGKYSSSTGYSTTTLIRGYGSPVYSNWYVTEDGISTFVKIHKDMIVGRYATEEGMECFSVPLPSTGYLNLSHTIIVINGYQALAIWQNASE